MAELEFPYVFVETDGTKHVLNDAAAVRSLADQIICAEDNAGKTDNLLKLMDHFPQATQGKIGSFARYMSQADDVASFADLIVALKLSSPSSLDEINSSTIKLFADRTLTQNPVLFTQLAAAVIYAFDGRGLSPTHMRDSVAYVAHQGSRTVYFAHLLAMTEALSMPTTVPHLSNLRVALTEGLAANKTQAILLSAFNDEGIVTKELGSRLLISQNGGAIFCADRDGEIETPEILLGKISQTTLAPASARDMFTNDPYTGAVSAPTPPATDGFLEELESNLKRERMYDFINRVTKLAELVDTAKARASAKALSAFAVQQGLIDTKPDAPQSPSQASKPKGPILH